MTGGPVPVALLGLGRMGAPMAARLAAAGHPLSTYNRTPRPRHVPAGTTAAPSPGAAVTGARVVVTMLAEGAALRAVLDGPDGVLAAAEAGTLVVDMSTVGPAAARETAAACEGAGLRFVDAPVSGSVDAARGGTLVAMAGGAGADVAEAATVLDALTREVLHLGPVGAGAAMKVALNLALAVTATTVAETLLLAERSGITRERAYDVLAAGALASPFVGYKREAFMDPEAAPVAFSVDGLRKDVALARELAEAQGLDIPTGDAAADVLDRAAARGLGAQDLAAVLSALA